MSFRADWLLVDPIEVVSELEEKLLSAGEIEKLATREGMSDVEKALLFLKSGQLTQKLWVVRCLQSIIKDGECNELFGELIVGAI